MLARRLVAWDNTERVSVMFIKDIANRRRISQGSLRGHSQGHCKEERGSQGYHEGGKTKGIAKSRGVARGITKGEHGDYRHY